MSLLVLDAGLLTTVQDLGRPGYARYGVPVGGALDSFALRAANTLVGNPAGAAALEFARLGIVLQVQQEGLAALTGCGFSLEVDGLAVPPWMAAFVRRGSVLRVVNYPDSSWPSEMGGIGYLAFGGGIDVPMVLGSRATDLHGHFGGWQGRPLQAGDALPPGVGRPLGWMLSRAGLELPTRLRPDYSLAPTLAVMLGPEDSAFTLAGIEIFLHSEYGVTPASDRMGSQLTGPAIERRVGADILSSGVVPGTIQVPGSGQPVLLLAGCQVTGGYTRIAVVTSADLPRAAQCPPGEGRMRFRAVSVEAAQARLRKQEMAFADWLEEIGEQR